jgi:hypothetical protein
MGIGGQFPIDDSARLAAGFFTVEGSGGITLYIPPKLIEKPDAFALFVAPHIGGTFVVDGLRAFIAGCAIGAGNAWVGATYEPKLIAGTWTNEDADADPVTAIGMRNSLSLNGLYSIFSIEIGHQFDEYGGGLHHSAVLLGRLDVGAAVMMGLLAVSRLANQR